MLPPHEKDATKEGTDSQKPTSTPKINADKETDSSSDAFPSAITTDIVAGKETGDAAEIVDPWRRAGEIVKTWELQKHRHLPKRLKEMALKIAYLHVTKSRGVIRPDIEKWNNCSKDYARRKIYLMMEAGLILPIQGRRMGRFQEYFISTEVDGFAHPDAPRTLTDSDIKEVNTFIQYLVGLLARKRPTFHKLSFFTQIPELYEKLPWSIGDPRNKSKVKKFRIESHRTVQFSVSPSGTTAVYLESTRNPYSLHSPSELVQLFSDLGEARGILKTYCRDSNDVPPINSWNLKLFDKDKTVAMSEIEKEMPSSVLRWWSDEGVKVEYMGHAFQIYGKIIPEHGRALRFEVSSSTADEKPLDRAIVEAIAPEVKFTSALDELEKRLSKVEKSTSKSDTHEPDNHSAQSS